MDDKCHRTEDVDTKNFVSIMSEIKSKVPSHWTIIKFTPEPIATLDSVVADEGALAYVIRQMSTTWTHAIKICRVINIPWYDILPWYDFTIS